MRVIRHVICSQNFLRGTVLLLGIFHHFNFKRKQNQVILSCIGMSNKLFYSQFLHLKLPYSAFHIPLMKPYINITYAINHFPTKKQPITIPHEFISLILQRLHHTFYDIVHQRFSTGGPPPTGGLRSSPRWAARFAIKNKK